MNYTNVTPVQCIISRFSKHLQCFHRTQIRWTSTQAQLPVISIPVTVAAKLERQKQMKKKQEWELQRKQSYMGDKSTLMISCKRKEFNHYRGQTYNKFTEVPLASKGWRHRKSAGDYFTINSYSGNPAFKQFQEGHELEFESLGLDRDILSQIYDLGFQEPTAIQALAIPHVLEGKNTLIAAETGNGKTLAFIAPMLQQIYQRMKETGSDLPVNSPLGLVIVPGRELADQIQEVASRLSNNLGIKVKVLTGGRTKRKMLNPSMSQQHLLIATIGALSKLTTVGMYDMNLVRHIILDEADSLLDDSFSDQVTRYLSKFPMQSGKTEENQSPQPVSGVQLTLVAATLPRSLHTILDPVVEIESIMKISTPYLNRLMPHVSQRFFRVSHRTKAEKLIELVKKDAKKGTPVIIFSNYTKTSNWLSLFLNENGVSCINLNGEMGAEVRKGRFQAYQSGQVLALSCTDLTSRGLDTVKVGHVINYEFPKFIADYVHRCGRTGRVGSPASGLVTNLVHRPQEIELVQKIEYAARKAQEFPNVNANIKRIIVGHAMKGEENLESEMEGN
ncbi:probable ATP-dependent RNA helicase DDX28 [Panulirus ornatus]|uniref:probable ATP-dependent RNA helicase DDX28 n=1 Tax=Panulirus ornatus TaxID=150431 RepID=UPI003A8A636C